ncbi:MAG: M3 family oligoendopeptidase [Campylobacteraceae bacterium]
MSTLEWDLKALYKDDNDLDEDVKKVGVKAQNFEKLFKNNLKKLSLVEFGETMNEYEEILQTLSRIMTYAFLKFAKDTNNGAFYAKYQNEYTKISEKLLFFELEFNKLPKDKQDTFIQNIQKYSYYLECLSKEKPHQLTQKEESVLLKKEQTGASAFSRLFDEVFSNMKFSHDGKKLSEEEILSLLSNKDRSVRKSASEAFTKELKKHQHLLSYIYNMVRADLKTELELRNYKNAEEPRHKDNKISQKSVDALVKTAEGSFGLVHEYYEKKREILGLEKLYDYDRYAPIDAKDEDMSYEVACKIVLDTFNSFSPTFGKIAQKAINEGWIDVYPKSAKRGGAFSHPATPNTHPYVLLNYTNKRRDLFTLAHELGHTIHQFLSYKVGYIASDTPLTTAETASVFAEMLVFDEVKKTLNKEAKKAMLGAKIEDIFATLYRQINFTTFERAVHKSEGELSQAEFNKLWMAESKKMFGKSVELTKNYEIWWSYIPHFIHTPFYCYAYSYGQLLVLALYGLYKSGDMKDFNKKYEEFLSSGGSKSPSELVKLFGFDIEDEKFWQIGLNEVKKLINEFKEL